jgi:hypothetical protein
MILPTRRPVHAGMPLRRRFSRPLLVHNARDLQLTRMQVCKGRGVVPEETCRVSYPMVAGTPGIPIVVRENCRAMSGRAYLTHRGGVNRCCPS